MNILASRNHSSGAVETNIPDTETTFDWLDYYSQEIKAMSSPEPLGGALAGLILVRFLVFWIIANRFPNHRTARTP